MRAKFNRPLIGIAALISALLVTKQAAADGPGWTANSTVSKLVVTYDGGVNVPLSPPLSNCVSNSGYGPQYASVYPNHPGINRIKADLLVPASAAHVQLLAIGNLGRDESPR